MIKVENISVYNIARAVYSARNAMNSWDKSDSDLKKDTLGPVDLDLAKRLYKGGSEHRKFLRQIFVTMDITAPIYWISEMDTYKIGTTRNSCSFMHKGLSKPFELSDFSRHATEETLPVLYKPYEIVIDTLNQLRDMYLETKDPQIFQQIRDLLPSGYNLRFTLTLNYENVANILKQRSNHRLQEWREFCDILRTLPYVKEIMEDEDGNS